MRNLVIFGDTQFAERLSKYIILEGMDCVVAFTQEERYMTRTYINGIPVVPFEKLCSYVKDDFEIILGIGYTKMNSLRAQLYYLCKETGYKVGSYISSNALVYSDAIGEGNFVCPGAVVGPGCQMGIGNYMESSAVLTHDNILGDFNFISTNAVFGGFACVDNNCFFGLHSTIKNDVHIASDNLVGASVNILKSIGCRGGGVGNPARQLVDKQSIDTKI